MSSVLTVRDLKKTYRRGFARKPVEALKGVSFKIQAGAVTGFLGANGAGKTTTIKCLLGLSFADSGEIEYFGEQRLSKQVKARLGFLPERPYFYEYLTGAEFLRFYGEISGQIGTGALKDRIQQLLKRVGLSQAGDRPLRSYSKGMLQRVGIAQALIHEPEFVILDEPMTGLDPDGRIEVSQIISETAKSGTAVFFSSHLLPDAEKLCQNLVILKQGLLVYEGSMAPILSRVGAGYRITSTNGGALSTEHASSLALVQQRLDELRRQGREITEVKAEKLTLEEAFIEMAYDKGASA